jgi:murein L,D-transpeptidase YcbB/YkuD
MIARFARCLETRRIVAPLIVLGVALAGMLMAEAGATQVAPALPPNGAIEAALSAPAPLSLDEARLDTDALRAVYEERHYAPLWVTGTRADQRTREVAAVLADAGAEGLDPRWYHTEAIGRRLGATDPDGIVQLELLLSDGVLRYAEHQTRGVTPPAPGDPEAAFEPPPLGPSEILLSIARASDPAEQLRALAPAQADYRRLRAALARYREIEKDGGWPVIPDGPKLRVGMSDPAVPVLRRRLSLTGEIDAASGSKQYDAALAVAVRTFQQRNGLAADGVLGPATRAELNMPVGRRIEQIIVNMERWRWVGPLGERYVKVNVPAFTLEMVEDGHTVLTMPVVVGKTTDRTPLFSAEIRSLVFNPSWHIPPRIVREEILPKARNDAAYLDRQGYVVRHVPARAPSGDDGGAEAVQTVMRLRQPPGPKNPLGRVKFNMPNVFGVYLHDTPSRGTFAARRRALSHGCVRLGKAMDLADALMTPSGGWSAERRQRLLSNWDTRTIALSVPTPVHVLYQTAWTDDAGAVHFRPDLYGRDDALEKQLVGFRTGRSSSLARRVPTGEPRAAGP